MLASFRLLALMCSLVLLSACSDSEQDNSVAQTINQPAANQSPSTEQTIPSAQQNDEQDKWWSVQPRPQWQLFNKVSTPNPWFEVYELRRNLYAIYEPKQADEVISYLIVGSSAALLFDTGTGIGDILSAAKSLTNRPIMVLNSHHHFDHIGGNHQFELVMALNHPFSRQAANGINNEIVSPYIQGELINGATPPMFDRNAYAIKPYEFSRWVSDGQILELGDVSLEVIHTPGHSPDSISLLDRKRRLLFTGDAYYPGPLYAQLPESDVEAYLDSISKLVALSDDYDYLLGSHNFSSVRATELSKVMKALEAIMLEQASFELNDTTRHYEVNGIEVLTRDPPFEDIGEISELPF